MRKAPPRAAGPGLREPLSSSGDSAALTRLLVTRLLATRTLVTRLLATRTLLTRLLVTRALVTRCC